MNAAQSMELKVGDKLRNTRRMMIGKIAEFGYRNREGEVDLLGDDNSGNGAFITYPGWLCSEFERYENLELLA